MKKDGERTQQYDERKDLHLWFGLSYAAFLVMPRVAMMQMPEDWQEKMAELLNQYDETIDTAAFGVADNQANEYAAELQERRKADSEREQVRSAHAEWSQATFGDVGPVGPLKHLSKEAMEAAAEPDDHSEWADMQFLLWDAQRRAGISDEQITQAMVEKLAVNKQREWPEPKDGEPRLHIKEQPAPENEAQATLKRLAVILHGSEVDLNLLTVTAQSLMDRCKAGNSPVTTE